MAAATELGSEACGVLKMRSRLSRPLRSQKTGAISVPQIAKRRQVLRVLERITLRVSPEGQRARDARIEDKPDRAAPHWLNSLVRHRLTHTGTTLCLDPHSGALGAQKPPGEPLSGTLQRACRP
jgi:hypothetical protein